MTKRGGHKTTCARPYVSNSAPISELTARAATGRAAPRRVLVIAQHDLAADNCRHDAIRLLFEPSRTSRQIIFEVWHLRADCLRVEDHDIRDAALAQVAASGHTPKSRQIEVIFRTACSNVSACFSRTQ